MSLDKSEYTILEIEGWIENYPNRVIDFIFPKLNSGQLSYWKQELKRYLYTIDGLSKTLPGYHETILRMVIRYWAEKNYPYKTAWIVFKSALLDGLCVGFYDSPAKIDNKLSSMFYEDKKNNKNIEL